MQRIICLDRPYSTHNDHHSLYWDGEMFQDEEALVKSFPNLAAARLHYSENIMVPEGCKIRYQIGDE